MQDVLKRIEADAKKLEMTVPEYVLGAVDFFSGFDRDFFKHINEVSEMLKVPMSTVIQQLLAQYIAQDKAVMDCFGTGSKTFSRAFQYDDNGLIEGNKHSDLVYEQVKKEITALREKLENAVKEKKPVLITRDDAALMSARL